MTDHFISFQSRDETLPEFFGRVGASYVVLYNSLAYPKVRPISDPFYKTVQSTGVLAGRWIGTFGDIGRDYSHVMAFQDTVLVYKVTTFR